jgi:hypothetical protein
MKGFKKALKNKRTNNCHSSMFDLALETSFGKKAKSMVTDLTSDKALVAVADNSAQDDKDDDDENIWTRKRKWRRCCCCVYYG